jgi:hypothetical protein
MHEDTYMEADWMFVINKRRNTVTRSAENGNIAICQQMLGCADIDDLVNIPTKFEHPRFTLRVLMGITQLYGGHYLHKKLIQRFL